MRFSICIPNYNYARFLGRTIRSVCDQSFDDFEIVVSDNASTDDSVAVVRGFDDPRIRLRVNRCNVGFSGNLDRAASMAVGDFLILLSSDDVMRPNALATYDALLRSLGPAANETIVCSGCEMIDGDDRVTETLDLPRHDVWRSSDRSAELSAALGTDVLRVAADELLGRCLRRLQNPYFFCATAYPRALYEAVEGYGGGRFIGPDKWFHWRVTAQARGACFIRKPLFGYRWHSGNQTARQSQSGALKYLLDEYAATFELDGALLTRLGLERREIERAFVEYDVVRHALALMADGRRELADRTLRFGRAAYPAHFRRNPRAWGAAALRRLGPLGSLVARAVRNRAAARTQAAFSAAPHPSIANSVPST